MGHNPSRTDLDRLIRTIINPDAIVSEVEKARCLASVNAYKTMMRRYRRTDPSPSLGAACTAGYAWMEVFCHGCRTTKRVDLGGVNAHPLAPITSIASHLCCKVCGERGPSIKDLHTGPAETLAQQRQREFGEQAGGWESRDKKQP